MEHSKIENRMTDRLISLFIPDIVILAYLYFLIYVLFHDPVPIWVFLSLVVLLVAAHVFILILIWPIYVIIGDNAVTLIYRGRKERKILWEHIVKIKISKWGYYVRYQKSSGVDYIPLTVKTATAIKEEWEKQKSGKRKGMDDLNPTAKHP